MPPALLKLVVLLLLVVQGVVAPGPGRVLCVPLEDCGQHHRSDAGGCDHCGRGAHAATARPGCQDHQHGLFDVASHPDDECGCHVHVPLPADEQLPSKPKGDLQDPRAASVSLAVAFVVASVPAPARTSEVCLRPPDFSASDQVRSLKATRLLI